MKQPAKRPVLKSRAKRRQPYVRAAVYSFMTLSVVVIVGLLLLVVLGYSFNQKDGKIEQGGLLQFQSVPSGATVTLDGGILGSKTSAKSTVDTGNHSVIYDRNGYRSWRKSIDITAGQIGWLSYARLIPTTITTSVVKTYPVLSGSLASPQHNYILLHEATDQPVFVLTNVQGDTVQYTNLTLPTGSYTLPTDGKTQSFSMERWSGDEQAVLIHHTYDDNKSEWILLNRGSLQKSINISATFAVDASKLIFAGGGNKLLFVQTGDVVRRINLDEQTLSRPLASRVAYFTEFDEKTITYATSADEKGLRTVGYAATDIPEPQTIATYPADGQPLYAAMSLYFNNHYIAMLHGTELKIVTGSLPTPDHAGKLKQFAKETVPVGALDLIMSRNGRFAVTQLADGFATYDIELTKFDRTTWAVKPSSYHELTWLDDYMIWSAAGGMLRFYEFDGANQQNIMSVAEGFSAGLSSNDKYIYGITKTDKGFELRRALLILP
jgi:hypothetical protein